MISPPPAESVNDFNSETEKIITSCNLGLVLSELYKTELRLLDGKEIRKKRIDSEARIELVGLKRIPSSEETCIKV